MTQIDDPMDRTRGFATFLKTGEEMNETLTQVPFSRWFVKSCGRLTYRKFDEDAIICDFLINITQRKLFLGELEFLTFCAGTYEDIYTHGNFVVAYIGTNCGSRMQLLAELFPSIKFHIFTSNEPNFGNSTITNIKVHTINFNNNFGIGKLMEILGEKNGSPNKKNVILLGRDWSHENPNFMDIQLKWINTIKPYVAMVTFSPQAPDNYSYAVGKFYKPIWGNPRDIETDLWIDGTTSNGLRSVTHIVPQYLAYLFRHNAITRMQHFDSVGGGLAITMENIDLFPGYDFDYDSVAELGVIIGYIKFAKLSSGIKSVVGVLKIINEHMESPGKYARFTQLRFGLRKIEYVLRCNCKKKPPKKSSKPISPPTPQNSTEISKTTVNILNSSEFDNYSDSDSEESENMIPKITCIKFESSDGPGISMAKKGFLKRVQELSGSDDVVIKDSVMSLVLDYPFAEKKFTYNCRSETGYTRSIIARFVRQKYVKIYKEDGLTEIPPNNQTEESWPQDPQNPQDPQDPQDPQNPQEPQKSDSSNSSSSSEEPKTTKRPTKPKKPQKAQKPPSPQQIKQKEKMGLGKYGIYHNLWELVLLEALYNHSSHTLTVSVDYVSH
jgi:hypothetical protein